MGINGSIEADTPFNEHFYGLVNFGNTCYVNSVLQALYFCKPFREKIIQYKLAHNQRIALLGMVESGGGGGANAVNGSEINSNNSYNMTASSMSGGGSGGGSTTTTNSTNGATTSSISTGNGLAGSSKVNANQVSILKQEHLLNCLAELFYSIVTMKKKKGVMQPKKFIARLRKDNESFDNLIQQDAHEFLNYLLNTCADILNEELKELKRLEEVLRMHDAATNGAISGGGGLGSKFSLKAHRALNSKSNSSSTSSSSSNFQQLPQQQQQQSGFNRKGSTNGSNRSISSKSSVNNNNSKANSHSNNNNPNTTSTSNTESAESNEPQNTSNNTTTTTTTSKEESTWIHELFQGILVNETKCLNCETSSSKEENFLDLSVDVEQNTSLNHCLQEFSNMEMLCGECKYYCETCRSKQEAEKRMRIKKLPKVLALHLKRFKFVGMLNKFKKLTYRVVFPFELRLFNTTEDCPNSDRIYDLVSFVVHCGIGLNRGHYISVVKSNGVWFLFDDETVEKIEVSSFEDFYGLPQETNKKSDTSYILFYEARQ